mmetsp:Transcript_10599/g.27469  ORF Transcript_10599/g.27469 Transcript_10599/m.27469 type:complete len:185 (+) Transcript_10599:359-913(+)
MSIAVLAYNVFMGTVLTFYISFVIDQDDEELSRAHVKEWWKLGNFLIGGLMISLVIAVNLGLEAIMLNVFYNTRDRYLESLDEAEGMPPCPAWWTYGPPGHVLQHVRFILTTTLGPLFVATVTLGPSLLHIWVFHKKKTLHARANESRRMSAGGAAANGAMDTRQAGARTTGPAPACPTSSMTC